MTRPQIVRADTIDLQDHSAPSAQNHRHLQQLGAGRPAPHQEQALRRAEEEAREELSNSPRVSLDRFDLDENTARINIALDGAGDSMADMSGSHHDYTDYQVNEESGVEGAAGDGVDDDLLDDDLMDKISSSPSIDDGPFDRNFGDGARTNREQRTLTSSSCTRCIRLSPRSKGKPMLQRETPWFFWMIATATGGL